MTAEATLTAPPYSRANPFPGKLVVNRRLSGPESAKDTRHLEIDLTGWGLTYEVGDSVAVYATNDPQLVDEMIAAKERDGLSERHTEDLRSRLKIFAAKFDGQMVATITSAEIDDWLRSLPVGPVTRNHYRSVTVQAFNFAI